MGRTQTNFLTVLNLNFGINFGIGEFSNIFSIYWYIVLRLSAPAFVVVLIWQFTNIWNDFIFAVTIVQNESQPMTVALNNVAGSFVVPWNIQMAAAFLTALPTLLVYIIMGRFFLRGLLAGSLKG